MWVKHGLCSSVQRGCCWAGRLSRAWGSVGAGRGPMSASRAWSLSEGLSRLLVPPLQSLCLSGEPLHPPPPPLPPLLPLSDTVVMSSVLFSTQHSLSVSSVCVWVMLCDSFTLQQSEIADFCRASVEAAEQSSLMGEEGVLLFSTSSTSFSFDTEVSGGTLCCEKAPCVVRSTSGGSPRRR